jgi:hypothetical protein
MGVDIYSLQSGVSRQIRIGGTTHSVGVTGRLWKVTETGDRQSRIDNVEALEDAQAARTAETPSVVLVDALYEFGDHREIHAYRLLGWDSGRVRTQDLDWDHLPTVGWAVDTNDGPLAVHEEVDGRLEPMSEDRAREMGILGHDGRLAEHALPVIAECRSVRGMGGGYYDAECLLGDGRSAHVLGESESGELPDTGWFVGRTTAAAARYGLVDQLAAKPGASE